MKLNLFIHVSFSCLLLLTSSCSEHSQSLYAETTTQEQKLVDSQILNIMMTVDKGEVAAAKEALKKKASPPVGHYAKYLIQQHQRNLKELNRLAKHLGIDPEESEISKSLENNGKKDIKTFQGLQNPEFEKAFIDAMVKEHQEGLTLIDSKLLPQAENTQLKNHVEQFRKMVSDHLEKALKIQKTL